MIELKSTKDLARLRRLALASQGMLQASPFGSGLAGACKAVDHIDYVQWLLMSAAVVSRRIAFSVAAIGILVFVLKRMDENTCSKYLYKKISE